MSSWSPGRSGWSSASLCTTRRQLIEERIDELAGLLPTVEAAPQHPQAPDELVAGIDRDQIAIGLLILAHSHKQRLDVVGAQGLSGIGRVDSGPRLEVEIGFGCPCRSRVERDGAVQRRVAEEECQANWDLQQFPGAAVKREVGK